MISRSFPHAYSGYDASLPPPLGFTTHDTASHQPTCGRMHRAGSLALVPSPPKVMMDPSDPSTWQRRYLFT
jgi:hypothetical protein